MRSLGTLALPNLSSPPASVDATPASMCERLLVWAHPQHRVVGTRFHWICNNVVVERRRPVVVAPLILATTPQGHRKGPSLDVRSRRHSKAAPGPALLRMCAAAPAESNPKLPISGPAGAWTRRSNECFALRHTAEIRRWGCIAQYLAASSTSHISGRVDGVATIQFGLDFGRRRC